MSSEDNVNASLELLLDTICNTFGGVLFISMLIVIMTNMTSLQTTVTPPSDESQAELAHMEKELNTSRKQLGTLRKALEQQAAIEQQVVDPEARSLIQRVTDLNGVRTGLTEDKSQAIEAAGRSQGNVNQIAKEIRELDEAMTALKAGLSAAQKKLKDEIAVRSRATRLPKLRETAKTEIAFFLKQGRLTAYAKKNPDGSLVPNQADFLETSQGGQQMVEPKQGAGIGVNLRGDATGEIARRFSDFDKGQHYLAVFVWPDSFDHFATVKDVMVLGQFEYRLVLMPKDKKVPVGASSGKVLVQ